MIQADHEGMSVREQCELLGLHRSTLYYQRSPMAEESKQLMRRIDYLDAAHVTWKSR